MRERGFQLAVDVIGRLLFDIEVQRILEQSY